MVDFINDPNVIKIASAVFALCIFSYAGYVLFSVDKYKYSKQTRNKID